MTRKARSTRARVSKAQTPLPRDTRPSRNVWLCSLVAALLAVSVAAFFMYSGRSERARASPTRLTPHTQVIHHQRDEIPCYRRTAEKDHVEGCHLVASGCARIVRDHFVTSEEVEQLRAIAEIGMANRSRAGGPTIMDINTGYVKDGDGLINIYQPRPAASNPTPRFTAAHFALYRRVIERIRLAVMAEFGLSTLYFTAPTFITRAIGNATWKPADAHDEYWHLHVDKDNTPHYDYSGLLYLAEYDQDFTGGTLHFKDGSRRHVIEPARGRLMLFTAGKENLHQVRKVKTGTRYVMSMWFTCDERKHFRNFLDGRMHKLFVQQEQERSEAEAA